MILRQNIAFDLDGVLVDLHSIFCAEIQAREGVEITNNGKFCIETIPPVSDAAIWQAFEACYKRIDDIPIIPGACELLRELYLASEGDPPMIVTARPCWAATDTYKLVNRIVGDMPVKLILCGGGMKKYSYLRGINFFVDDRRRIALDLARNHGKFVYMPLTDYNRLDAPVEHIGCIKSVADLLPFVSDLIKVDIHYA